MLKELQRLINSLKEVETEDLANMLSRGASFALNSFMRATFPLYRKIMIAQEKYKSYKKKKAFDAVRDEYLGNMVKVNIDEHPEFYTVSMELRRQFSQKGLKLPSDIFVISNSDILGIKHEKLVLIGVEEGEEGIKEDGVLWVNDGYGKVYSYKGMQFVDYLKFVANQKSHPFHPSNMRGSSVNAKTNMINKL